MYAKYKLCVFMPYIIAPLASLRQVQRYTSRHEAIMIVITVDLWMYSVHLIGIP